jgi:ADP-ribosylglycohydrolase
MSAPNDYLERVYAGVLGKIIGVYLGRPFEGWAHQRIETELGEIWNYVHERFGVPLVAADDDISGTFTFLRALPDHGGTADLTPEQIGLTWLNYIVENRSILWWGGMGNSTEHTAFLRLNNGIPAPLSGAIATNGKTVAEQIGAQIFIDGWALVSPGNPGLAVELARKAASVSHDGEAIYAAQLVAAMEAQAFVDPRIDQLIETGLTYLPRDCLITRLVNDVRNWRRTDDNWRLTRERIEKTYGYDKFPGNCHVIPNHAIIILSLLYSEDDFRRALMIANTSGWDTDCNSGNVGCLMGIKNGLTAIDAKLREPVADRLFLSTADGGRCLTDAVRETYEICRVASHYSLMACPTLYPGNLVHGRLIAGAESSAPVRVVPFIAYYAGNDELHYHQGPALTLTPAVAEHFQWQIEELNGAPILQFGLEVSSDSSASGRLYVDYIDWSGTPTTVFRRPDADGKMWLRAWINAVDHVGTGWASAFHLSQNRGTGLFIQGSRDWQNYAVEAAIVSDPVKSFGLAARVQGLTRYYALMLGPNQSLRLIRNYDAVQVLAEVPYRWSWSERYHFNLIVNATTITGSINGSELIRYDDPDAVLLDGGIALVCEEGLIMTDEGKVAAA